MMGKLGAIVLYDIYLPRRRRERKWRTVIMRR